MRPCAFVLVLWAFPLTAQPADYFPLGPEDSWTYGYVVDPPFAPADTVLTGTVRVLDTVTIRDTTYSVARFPELFTDTLRTDARGRVWGRLGGRDLLLMDVTLTDGATYLLPRPSGARTGPDVYVVTVSRPPSVRTIAGLFEDVVAFSFDIPESLDDEVYVALASGVGVVASGAALGAPFELVEARVSGRLITATDGPPPPAPLQVFPNPTASTLTVVVPAGGWERAEVADALGRRVAVLLSGPCPPDACRLSWDAEDAAPGVYVVWVSGRSGHLSRLVVRAR